MFRLRTAGSTRGGGRIRAMRAETVIATHTNADFDALASLLAVRRLYPGSVAALPGSLARNVREFYRLHADELDVCETSRLDPAAIERLVVVETVHASRLGELEPVARDPQIEKVVFDHHGDALPDWLPPENAILSDDAALTTTLVGVLAELRGDDAARRRRARVVPAPRRPPRGSRDLPPHGARARGARAAGDPARLARNPHHCRPRGRRRRRVERARRRQRLDARAQARRPDRGAGARLPARDGRPRVLRRPQPGAGARRAGARGAARRRRPSRRGLGDVQGDARRRTREASERAPARRARAGPGAGDHVAPAPHRLARRHRGPRALGAAAEPSPAEERSLAEELRSLRHLAPVWEAVAAVSEEYEGAYLVGGTVRDILLGEPNFDVDVAVEGDAVAFAEALAGALGGRIKAHRKFGTAVVLYGEGGRVDVVTARTEFYDAPAALPTVEHATIREDLFRRDFTINAMAVSLQAADFGRLVDPFGGRRDLENRTIRVLHNLSFIDDPTRIFRAVRYESRLDFAMSEHTARLARCTVDMGLVGDLSSARLRDELVALLDEEDAGRSIRRLADLGVARAIHPHLAADDETVALLDRLRALVHEYDLSVRAWRVGLEALAPRMSPDEVYDWLERLRVRRRR